MRTEAEARAGIGAGQGLARLEPDRPLLFGGSQQLMEGVHELLQIHGLAHGAVGAGLARGVEQVELAEPASPRSIP